MNWSMRKKNLKPSPTNWTKPLQKCLDTKLSSCSVLSYCQPPGGFSLLRTLQIFSKSFLADFVRFRFDGSFFVQVLAESLRQFLVDFFVTNFLYISCWTRTSWFTGFQTPLIKLNYCNKLDVSLPRYQISPRI